VIDNQTRDETQNQFKSAEAGRNEAAAKVTSAEAAVIKAEADRDKAGADVTAFEAKSDVAKADARRVTALLDYTRVKAPFDGIVTRRTVATGDLVTADGKQGLFAVARIDPVRVVVAVPEADAGAVTLGQEVRISLQGAPGPGEKGAVARTSWSLEPGSRTLRVEVDLPNPDSKVRPGTFVTARLSSEVPAEWAVPAAAIGKANDEPALYLAENGKAVRVAVQLLKGDGHFTQVRRYKRPASNDWTDFTGAEAIASPASALSDGQDLPRTP
jgi:HlyD family secretion protein